MASSSFQTLSRELRDLLINEVVRWISYIYFILMERGDLENQDVNGDVCDVVHCFNMAQHGDLC
jgi:hypothetical protein